MKFETPLISGRLIRRYMRFLCDVELEDGQVVKAHCPNPGSMLGLKEVGARVWLEPNDDPKKKLDWGWRLIEVEHSLVGIDTAAANRIVGEAFVQGRIPELAGLGDVKPEVKYGKNSRVDFLIGGNTYVEVKSVTLSRQEGLAEFPDSVTERGRKHLNDLADMVAAGHRAILLFLIQREDCDRVDVAADIDPKYAQTYHDVRSRGVEILAYDCTVAPDAITLRRKVDVR